MQALKFIAYCFCYLLYPLSFLMPRTKKVLVFGSFHGAFNDNSKYLFLYANRHLRPQYRPVWISTKRETEANVRRLGGEAYWVASAKGIWLALRGRWWFVNAYTSDIAFFLSGGAHVVNLWHGLPWKCIEFGIKKGALAKRYSKEDKWDVFFHPACFIRPDYVASGGEKVTEILARSFRIDDGQCIPCGYPRNYLLGRPQDEVLDFIGQYESPQTLALAKKIQGYTTTYIYMPTWRDSQRNLFAKGLDLNALNEVMAEQGALAIMKPHPNTARPEHTDYSNLIFMDSTADVYAILPLTDVLITDYSSVMFDYPLMRGKSMILYQYDYDEYVTEREFNFPLEGNIIGRKVTSFDELLDVIRRKDYQMDDNDRAAFLQKFWGNTADGDSCKKLIDKVL